MNLPKYHETFIPILKVLADNKEIHRNDLRIRVRDKFYINLPKELLEKRTKSGDIVILNRIGWGGVYLKQAKMIYQPERGIIKITDKGKMALEAGELTLRQILHDDDFLSYRQARAEEKRNTEEEIDENATPEDMVDAGIHAIEAKVKNDLLDKLKTIDPYYFEKIILQLLNKMGYGDFIETSKSNDGGIDGVINQDQLGLEKIYVQAKRYNENKVREGDIRNFIGAMSGDTNKGIFVTTSIFDDRAISKAQGAHHRIILIDGIRLADLMYKYGIGTQVKNNYEIKELDEDYFDAE